MDIKSEGLLKNKKQVIKTKQKFVGDSVIIKKKKLRPVQLSKLHSVINDNLQNNTYTLLLGNGRTDFFVTEDSKKYISQKQQDNKKRGYSYIDSRGYFDSLHVEYVKTYSTGELQYNRITSEFRNAIDIAESFHKALKFDLSPIRMWQVSLAGAVLFGMVSMSMIYSNLGQSAMAKGAEGLIESENKPAVLVIESKKGVDKIEQKTEDIKEINQKQIDNVKKTSQEQNKDVEEAKKNQIDSIQKKVNEIEEKKEIKEKKVKQIKTQQKRDEKSKQSVDSLSKKENDENNKNKNDDIKKEKKYSLKKEAEEMVKGYPIEKMLPYILEQDPEVAKYLIAMAKQESQWGKRVPVLNGQDCYNYWGYRSKRKLMGSGGHTCFNSRKDAVETVGKRINDLIYKYDRTTANDLIVWKCGSSCEGHSKESVNRWINTVDSYYNKLSQ